MALRNLGSSVFSSKLTHFIFNHSSEPRVSASASLKGHKLEPMCILASDYRISFFFTCHHLKMKNAISNVGQIVKEPTF